MRFLMVFALAIAAGPVAADIASSPGKTASPPSPQSIWKAGDAGAIEHLQSGLVCPARIDGYERTDIHVFNAFGLDVGCNFRAGPTLITVYLTRRDGSDLPAAMTEAKRELLQSGAERHPQALSQTQHVDSGLDWTVAPYSEDGGLRSSIWIADLSGWTLEYRATYPAADEARAAASIAAVTAVVRASAGARLAQCARSPAPARAGIAVSDRRELEQSSMMTSVLGGAMLMAAREGKAMPGAPDAWCVEKAITVDGHGLLFWRAVRTDGEDAAADRITLMTDGPPPVLTLAPGVLEQIIDDAKDGKDKPPRWAATMERGDRTLIFGYFDGRPSTDAVSDLFMRILKGDAKPIGSYSASGKTITIGAPTGP